MVPLDLDTRTHSKWVITLYILWNSSSSVRLSSFHLKFNFVSIKPLSFVYSSLSLPFSLFLFLVSFQRIFVPCVLHLHRSLSHSSRLPLLFFLPSRFFRCPFLIQRFYFFLPRRALFYPPPPPSLSPSLFVDSPPSRCSFSALLPFRHVNSSRFTVHSCLRRDAVSSRLFHPTFLPSLGLLSLSLSLFWPLFLIDFYPSLHRTFSLLPPVSIISLFTLGRFTDPRFWLGSLILLESSRARSDDRTKDQTLIVHSN